MITGKTYKSDGTVETVTYENADYFEMIGLTPETLMHQLRIQRNQLLQQTDWRMTTDYPYSDQSAWASYRRELRNLPQTANPTLDEQGNLIVDWPQAPDNV